jgi:hypothetical protein
MWSRINSPRWGLDNWIYAVNGIGSGGRITGPHLPAPVEIGATCFRFRADGTAIEPVSGSTSGFGLTMNDWGDRFLVSNQQHVLLGRAAASSLPDPQSVPGSLRIRSSTSAPTATRRGCIRPASPIRGVWRGPTIRSGSSSTGWPKRRPADSSPRPADSCHLPRRSVSRGVPRQPLQRG